MQRCDAKEPLNLKGFAAHMTSHGKIADYQMCVLVLGQVVDCMKELLTQGQPVKLDGFGTFSPSVDGQKLGKANLAEAVAGGPEAMINGIHINFNPENTKGEKLTSRGPEGGLHLRLRLSRGEREAHGRRQGEAIPEEDAADVCAGSYGG